MTSTHTPTLPELEQAHQEAINRKDMVTAGVLAAQIKKLQRNRTTRTTTIANEKVVREGDTVYEFSEPKIYQRTRYNHKFTKQLTWTVRSPGSVEAHTVLNIHPTKGLLAVRKSRFGNGYVLESPKRFYASRDEAEHAMVAALDERVRDAERGVRDAEQHLLDAKLAVVAGKMPDYGAAKFAELDALDKGPTEEDA